jgi:predicted nucleotidyltransferase
MATYEDHVEMIRVVAKAMGPDLCKEVAFVGGGCTTALLLTDQYTLQQVRHTDDVDLIVHVISQAGWTRLLERLRARGFKEQMQTDAPICAMYLGYLRVDFMPDDDSVLGFSNIWYKDALKYADRRDLGDGTVIGLVRPEYFIATKLVAFLARGDNDPLASRDIEDILSLIDGRPEIMDELLKAPSEMRTYVSQQLAALNESRDFEYAVQAASNGDPDREEVIAERINLIISFGALG